MQDEWFIVAQASFGGLRPLGRSGASARPTRGRRHGPDLRPQGLPEADEGRGGIAERDPGRLFMQGSDGGVNLMG